MQLRIEKNHLVFRICFFVCMLYVLMRPFLVNYVSSYCKYIFLLLVVAGVILTFLSRRYLGKIGYKELFLLTTSYIYILLNAWLTGGRELISLSITAYVFYTFPVIIMPLLMDRINWSKVFRFVSFFGVIDAGISIVEFISKKQMFPMSGVEGEITLITKAGAYVARTYGLQGSYFILAEILCFCGLVSFYLLRFERKKIDFIAWIIISVGILTTGTRGYYVSYVVGILAMYFCERFVIKERKKISKKVLISFLGAGLACVVCIYLILGTGITTGNANFDMVLNRIRMVFDWRGDSANVRRISIWKWAIGYWQEAFWFGHGACSSDIRYSGYIQVAESGIFKRLVELGLVGTILQYLTMFVPLQKGIGKLRRNKLDTKSVVFLGTIIAYLVEDCILERYTTPEYTILIWISISYLAYFDAREEER